MLIPVWEYELVSGRPNPPPSRVVSPVYRLELVRESYFRVPEGIAFGTVEDIVRLMARVMLEFDREHLVIVGTDKKLKPKGVTYASVGTLDSTLVHPREVFKPLLLMKASRFVTMHNHPSGTPSFSNEDTLMSQKLERCGEILDIAQADFVAIGEDGWASITDKKIHPLPN